MMSWLVRDFRCLVDSCSVSEARLSEGTQLCHLNNPMCPSGLYQRPAVPDEGSPEDVHKEMMRGRARPNAKTRWPIAPPFPLSVCTVCVNRTNVGVWHVGGCSLHGQTPALDCLLIIIYGQSHVLKFGRNYAFCPFVRESKNIRSHLSMYPYVILWLVYECNVSYLYRYFFVLDYSVLCILC